MSKREPKAIDKEWLALIQEACPRGVVDMPMDPDATYFARLYPRLRRALARIKGASILCDRDGAGERVGVPVLSSSFSFDDDDDDDDWEHYWADAHMGVSFSYHLFFVGLSDPAFEAACETEREDDQGTVETIAGKETFGYLVGVSLLVPVTMVQQGSYACFEDGSTSLPDLRDDWHDSIDPLIEPGEDLASSSDEGTTRALKKLRASITRVLTSAKLKELPRD